MSAQINRAPTQPCAGSLAPRVPRHLHTTAALAAESQTLIAQLLASGLTGSADLSFKLLVLHLGWNHGTLCMHGGLAG